MTIATHQLFKGVRPHDHISTLIESSYSHVHFPIDVLLLSGRCAGQRIFLPRIPMSPSDYAFPIKIVWRQFPTRLTWMMIINRAQGRTLQRRRLRVSMRFFISTAHSSCACFLNDILSSNALSYWSLLAESRLRSWPTLHDLISY